jgi:hypothetical protein
MSGKPATQTSRSSDPPPCLYPQSNRVSEDIRTALEGVAANKSKCASFYLDTVEGMSNNFPYTEGEDHHQGLARTHKLSDGSIYFFLSTPKPIPAIREACPSTDTPARPIGTIFSVPTP